MNKIYIRDARALERVHMLHHKHYNVVTVKRMLDPPQHVPWVMLKREREGLNITPPTVAYDANSKWCLKNYFCVCHRQRPCVCEAACKGDELILLLCIFCLLPKGILQRCLHAVACEARCLFFVMGPNIFWASLAHCGRPKVSPKGDSFFKK